MPLSPPELDDVRDGPACLSALTGPPRLALWLAEHARLHPGTDAKAAGAFLLGGLAFELARPLAEALLDRGAAPLPGPGDVTLRLGWATWRQEGEEAPALALRVRVAEGLPAGDAAALGARLATLLAPLVGALSARTRLAAAAHWRLAADALASAALDAAVARGGAPEPLARALLAAPPLRNRQWSFFELDARDRHGRPVRETHLSRGGCCRYYTVEGGECCTSCVLRDQESRERRLRERVAKRPLTAPVVAGAA